MKGRIAFTLATAALMVFAGYAALFIAPDEKTMHAIQRIFYFHVSSAITAFVAFFIVFIANIAYLGTRKREMGLARRSRCGSGRCMQHDCADHRAHLGASCVGHLVDVGRAADFDFCFVAAVHVVLCCCAAFLRSRSARLRSLRSSEFSRFWMCRSYIFPIGFGERSIRSR